VVIYVLTLRGVPVAAAYRFERLNERVGDGQYSQEDQQHMEITPVDILT
jgi:hypothetical protein